MKKSWDKEYWDNRYKTNDISWDTGDITPPLKEYFDQLNDKNLTILIPGAGNAYEAEYLHNCGFTNVSLVDLSEEAIKNFRNRVPSFPEKNIFHEDFFQHYGTYDIIVEQTFFCAIDPILRDAYAEKVYDLLKPGGKLVGLLFNDRLNAEHPPFGGNIEEYRTHFMRFNPRVFETACNSIKPRAGREIFMILQK